MHRAVRKKRKFVFIPTFIIAGIFIFSVWHIHILFNLSVIRDLRNNEYLYQTYQEVDLVELYIDPTEIIKFNDIELQHGFGIGEVEENSTTEGEVEESTEEVLRINFNNVVTMEITSVPIGVSGIIYNLPDAAKELIAESYGAEIFDSNFNLLRKTYELTPDELAWFHNPRKKYIASMWLLLFKSYHIPENEGDILLFETNNVQGFQYTIARDNNEILLELFDPLNLSQYYYRINLKGNVTQKDINYILSTINFVR